MKSVADTHHLQRRGAVCHYYRRVPDALAKALGRRFIKYSLGVTSLADARKLRTIEDLKTDALFAAAEKGKGSAPNEPKHSLAALVEHVRSTMEQLGKRSAEALAPDKKIKLILTYPMSTDRNFQEILRAIDSIQLTAKFPVATPADWKPVKTSSSPARCQTRKRSSALVLSRRSCLISAKQNRPSLREASSLPRWRSARDHPPSTGKIEEIFAVSFTFSADYQNFELRDVSFSSEIRRSWRRPPCKIV
jgi:hypothetical protein